MFDSVNWENVWQSVMDFWVPTFGWVIAIIVILIIIKLVKKKK